jgi:hypothetical protein
MKQLIVLPVKAISVNSMYYGNRLHGKTAEAQDWSHEVLFHLSKYKRELKNFRDYFDPSKHVYKMHLTMMVPVDVYYTKKGELTSKIVDLTNWEKPLIDLIMLKKFFGGNVPYQCENLNTDDRYLQYMISEKVPTEQLWGIKVIIEIADKPIVRP